jgi:hypothetical protein
LLAFAHSVGDSVAAIHFDPDSQVPKDPHTFPWIPGLQNREHVRDIHQGWAWGLPPPQGCDDQAYHSEQILSTTLFRLYRALGVGLPLGAERRDAADLVVYLIFRAIGNLPLHAITPTSVDAFATALIDADVGTTSFQKVPGGAVHKVIRWSFEKQGLYRLPSTLPGNEGDPPDVDVCIDDGRAGEYQDIASFPPTSEMWNRLASDGGNVHEAPRPGATGYLYVRVHNRGTQDASSVRVSVFVSKPGANLQRLTWPADWQLLPGMPVSAKGPVPSGKSDVVGPIKWAPRVSGELALLASVSADGDLSNIDTRSVLPCAKGPIANARLVPFDNNLAERTLVVEP